MAEPMRRDSEPAKDTASSSVLASSNADAGMAATSSSDKDAKSRVMRRNVKIAVGVLLAGVLAWGAWQTLFSQDPTKLTFTPWGSDAEAKALVQRMLQVNKPWLDLAPVAATYTLRATKTRKSIDPRKWSMPERKQYGPFSVTPVRLPAPPPPISGGMDEATIKRHRSAAEQRRIRVGAELVTPLDYMANEPHSYKVQVVGYTCWKSRKVVGVDVTFDNWVQCRIGMDPDGRGGNVVYGWGYGTREVRILIDAEKAVPLMIIAYTAQGGKYDPRKGTTWEFDPDFIAVDGGLAPRSVIWLSKDDYRGRIRMRLGFQAFDGIWIFHDGEYRWGGLISSNPDLSLVRRLGEDLLVCRYQLKDLRFQTSGKTSPIKNSNGTNDRFKLPGWQAEPERAGPH